MTTIDSEWWRSYLNLRSASIHAFKPHDTCIYIYTNTCYPLEEKLGWRNERRGSTSPSKHGEFRDAIHSRFVHWLKLFKARHSTGYAYGVSTINFSSRTMIEFFRPRRRRNKFRLDGSETFVDYIPTKDEIGIHGCVAPSRRFRG